MPETSTSSPSVFFVPLGGLGEIGMNCFALQQGNEILLVDCGATFPDDDLGIDLIIPDFSWLLERQSQLVGLFITHGHEDHIGAIPYLLSALEQELPIYAPEHASYLIANRLSDHKISSECLRRAVPGSIYAVGSFKVEPIAVAHSIIDATALCIETYAGKVLHTADFDLDAEQPAGHLTDEYRLKALGQEGVRLLLSDSTNIDTPSRERNEGDVGRALVRVIGEAEQRVVVAMFSSNIHRLVAVGRAAVQSERRLCFLGRSLRRQFEIATRMGRLSYPSSLLVEAEALAELPRDEVLVVAGGSQGEGNSSLRRLSLGTHPHLSLEEKDSVIFSSRVIPGNEKPVFTMTNDLSRRGVVIKSPLTDPDLHVSGHASRAELEKMIEWTTPQSFMPLHGTLHHLRQHEELARDLGVSDTCIVEDGAVVEIPREGTLRMRRAWTSQATRIAYGGSTLDAQVRRARGDLGRGGVVSASVAVDSNGCLQAQPRIACLGVPGLDGHKQSLSSLEAVAAHVARAHQGQRMLSLEVALRRALKAAILERSATRPQILVQVLELEV